MATRILVTCSRRLAEHNQSFASVAKANGLGTNLRGSFCYPIYSWLRVISLIGAGKLPVEKAIGSRISVNREG